MLEIELDVVDSREALVSYPSDGIQDLGPHMDMTGSRVRRK